MNTKRLIPVFLALVFLFSGAAAAYDGYPSPDEMYAEIDALAAQYPELVEIGEYGRSVQGRPLMFIKIARKDGGKRPEAMIAAGIHGNEWIGNRVAMGAARRLLEGAKSDPWIAKLLDGTAFYILPCLNPDGYVKTWELRDDNKAPWTEMRKNANGVDPNRNFPLPAERTVDDELAGSDDPASIRYTGPHPYSEPETAAVRDFAAARSLFAAIDLHSAWGTFFPPKCNGAACEKQFKKMMEAAREKQPHSKYLIVQQWRIDSFSGEMEDTLFYNYGVMAVCWEVFPPAAATEQQKDPKLSHPFWSMNPLDIGHWLENDVYAVLAALETALEITGGAPVPEKNRQVRLK